MLGGNTKNILFILFEDVYLFILFIYTNMDRKYKKLSKQTFNL